LLGIKGGSLGVSVPIEWVEKNRLKKGDSLRVEYDENDPSKLILLIAP
jgi:antitoxin component of MazEF toxin-antitoxin module